MRIKYHYSKPQLWEEQQVTDYNILLVSGDGEDLTSDADDPWLVAE